MARLSSSDSKTSAVPTEEGKPLFSKYGSITTCLNLFSCTPEHSLWMFWQGGGKKWAEHCCNKPQEIFKGERQDLLPKCGKNFYQRNEITGYQNGHSENKPYECPEHEKSFRHRQAWQQNQNAPSGRKLQKYKYK